MRLQQQARDARNRMVALTYYRHKIAKRKITSQIVLATGAAKHSTVAERSLQEKSYGKFTQYH
jgi:hypothetical protein